MSRVELFADGKSLGVFDGDISVEVPAETRQLRAVNLDPVNVGTVTIHAGPYRKGRPWALYSWSQKARPGERRRQRRARKLKRGF